MEILTIQESIARLDLQMVISPQQKKIVKFCDLMLDGKPKCCLLVAKFFLASFYVLEMLIFGKLIKR